MNSKIKDLTYIALFPALMGATAGISFPLFNLPAITLQTLFVFMAGLILGPKKAAISMSVYLLLGAIGLPIFSGFRGGFGVLLGTSGGFLIGFVFSAYFVGFMKNINFINRNIALVFSVLLIGNMVIYMFGSAYIAYLYKTNVWLILAGFGPYLFGDVLKALTCIYVYVRIESHVTYEHV